MAAFDDKSGNFTGQITPDGPFKPEKGRYHLYGALFCPFAHRALLMRKLKGLEDVLPVTILHWSKGTKDAETGKWTGWHFDASEQGCEEDPLFGAKFLSELYFKAKPDYSGAYAVPVLWDKKLNTIVSNDSADLMRQFSTAFDSLLPEEARGTYVPQALAGRINELSPRVQAQLNSGVYKAGNAKSQDVYEAAAKGAFEMLDELEDMMAGSSGPFLLGSQLTELDVRVYTSAIRFDVLYNPLFRVNARQLRQYPHLNSWLKRLYHLSPAFSETASFDHMRKGFFSNTDWNPSGLIPIGPSPPIEPLEDSDKLTPFSTAPAKA